MSSFDKRSPRLSVVMSVFNGGRLLGEAIDSVLAQTMPDFEFVIVNDGSTDSTLRTLEIYAKRDGRIKVINQANTGLTMALKRAVAASTGPLIARMDADDLSSPDRFERQISLLDLKPHLVAVSCGIENIGPNLVPLGIVKNRYDCTTLPLLLAFSNVISGHGQMMIRRVAYETVAGYDSRFRYSQDYDLWCRLLKVGPIEEVDGVLYRFRIGHNSISTRNGDNQRALAVGIAANQYRYISGSVPKIEQVQDAMDWWLPQSFAYRSTWRQIMVDRHIRFAVRKYIQSNSLSSSSLIPFYNHLAQILVSAHDSVPKNQVFKRAILKMLIVRWIPRRSFGTLLVKLGLAPVAPGLGIR